MFAPLHQGGMTSHNTVKARNKLKNVKKKFLLITESSTSSCEIMPWYCESPVHTIISN